MSRPATPEQCWRCNRHGTSAFGVWPCSLNVMPGAETCPDYLPKDRRWTV